MEAENSSDALLDIVEQIYEFDDVDELLTWFFTALNRVLPFRTALYLPFKPGSYAFQEEGVVRFNLSKESISHFFQHHASKVPLYAVPATIKTMAPNKGIRVNKMLPGRLYKQMPVYKFFFKPYGVYWVMPSLLVACNTALGGFVMHRKEEQPPFSKEDKIAYDRIAPHLARAIFLCGMPVTHQQMSVDEKLKHFRLTKRQKEVVGQLLQGYSNHEIADQLFITEQTVKDHLYVVFKKVSVRNRTQLIALLSRNANEEVRQEFNKAE